MRNYLYLLGLLVALGLPLSASAERQYLVVLGSFQERSVAVAEVRKFNAREADAKLAIVVKSLPGGQVYRIVEGPAEIQQANVRLQRWQSLGITDAWLTPGTLPAIRESIQ